MEVWKLVGGFDMYEVSNYGNIRSYWNNRHGRSVTPHTLKVCIGKNGYAYYDFCSSETKKRMLIHRVVATEFLQKPDGYDVVDHIDRNPLNNNVNNLRWCTTSINIRNTKLSTRNTSGCKHIIYDRFKNKWKFQCQINGKKYSKRFENMADAINHRDEYLQLYSINESWVGIDVPLTNGGGTHN